MKISKKILISLTMMLMIFSVLSPALVIQGGTPGIQIAISNRSITKASPPPTEPPDGGGTAFDPTEVAENLIGSSGCTLDPRSWIPCLVGLGQKVFIKLISVAVSGVSVVMSNGVAEAIKLGDTLPTNPMYQDQIKTLWGKMRDIALSLLVVGLLVIAMANVLNIQGQVYGLNRMLPKIVITIFLTIFSYAVANFLLNFSTSLTETLRGFLTSGAVSNMAYFPPDPVGDMTNLGETAAGTAIAAVDANAMIFMAIIAVIIIVISGLFLMLVLLTRIIMIYLLISIAPIAFILQLLPFTEGYYKQWWTQFIKWTFMGPVIMVILYVGTMISGLAGTGNGFVSMLAVAIAYGLAAGVPLKMGNAMTSFLGNQMKKLGNLAKGAATKPVKEAWGSFRAPARAAAAEKNRARGRAAGNWASRKLGHTRVGNALVGTGSIIDDPNSAEARATRDRHQRQAYREEFKNLDLETAQKRLEERLGPNGDLKIEVDTEGKVISVDQEALALMDKISESHLGATLSYNDPSLSEDENDAKKKKFRNAYASAFEVDEAVRTAVITNKDENATQKIMVQAGETAGKQLRTLAEIKATGSTPLTTSSDSVEALNILVKTETDATKKEKLQKQVEIVYDAAREPEKYKQDPRKVSEIVTTQKTAQAAAAASPRPAPRIEVASPADAQREIDEQRRRQG